MSYFHGYDMARLPPLSALRSFEAAARNNSFSRAADELHVTQSAVSHQIRQLETWFGIALFDRQGRQTLATNEGAELARSLADAFGIIGKACDRLVRSDGKPSLTVAAIPSVATIWLIPKLAAFHKLNPNINVRLMHANYGQQVDFEDVDLAITYGDWKEAPSHSTKFLEGVSYPVCSSLYREQIGFVEHPSELLNCALLHDTDRRYWLRWFKALGEKSETQLPGALFEGFNLLHSAILSGQGVGLAPTAILDDDLKSGRLVKLFDTGVLQEKAYYISEPPNPRLSCATEVDVFKSWLLTEAAKSVG
jgi:LysR family transcriptional regulator, glycine cleavage system transcriptional activator